MRYTIAAHPTRYKDVLFRSRLEARWAAFFDLADWKWEYEPVDLVGWSPDFRIEYRCPCDECNGRPHALLIEVKPYNRVEDFVGHPCLEYMLEPRAANAHIDGYGAFGDNPEATIWRTNHIARATLLYDVYFFIRKPDLLWKMAGEAVQYHPHSDAAHDVRRAAAGGPKEE